MYFIAQHPNAPSSGRCTWDQMTLTMAWGMLSDCLYKPMPSESRLVLQRVCRGVAVCECASRGAAGGGVARAAEVGQQQGQ